MPCFDIRQCSYLYGAWRREREASFSPTRRRHLSQKCAESWMVYRWQLSWQRGRLPHSASRTLLPAWCLELELLKLSHRTAVPRHRTLKATLDWSYDLLSDAERIVFRRVAPFVGHFTLEAARNVAGELGAGTGEIFDAIAGLVEKSLIATRIDETQAQYRLLDTTRAYALEKLEEHAEVDVVLRRHSEYVAGYLESQRVALLALANAERPAAYPSPSGNIRAAPERSFGLRGNNQIAMGLSAISTHSSQLGNIRAALEWSFGPHGDDEIATRLAAALTQLFSNCPC